MLPGSARDQYHVEIQREAGRDREFTAASVAFLQGYMGWAQT
jgi:hypothetical protein